MTDSEFFQQYKQQIIDDLFALIRIPSISTRPESRADIQKAADWMSEKLKHIGLENVQQTLIDEGHPIVTGQKIFDEKLPTLLVYGHYDVQPAEPLDAWKSEPFAPEIRDGAIFGRGATDDKGQLITNLAAIAYYLLQQETKTWNIKVAIEGEEEIGSPSIQKMIATPAYKELFTADYAYISDGPWDKMTEPSVEFSLRGLCYFDLELKTATADAHSGLFGNTIMNAGNLAGYVVYKLKDILRNKVRVPNIYKQMRKLSDDEIAEISKESMTWEEVQAMSGALVTTPYHRRKESFAPAILTGTRPSLDVHGIQVGFTEPGRMKTVIPSTALVKFSIRLVPFMDPEKTVQLVEKYIAKIVPKGTEYKLTCISKDKAYLVDPKDPKIMALKKAYEVGFGKVPHLAPSGGSIGLVVTLDETYGVKSLLASYGLPDDRLHGPNEKYNLSQLEGGFKTLVAFLAAES